MWGEKKAAKPGDDPKHEFFMKDQDKRPFAFASLSRLRKSIVSN